VQTLASDHLAGLRSPLSQAVLLAAEGVWGGDEDEDAGQKE
jgi:hypothetical protein